MTAKARKGTSDGEEATDVADSTTTPAEAVPVDDPPVDTTPEPAKPVEPVSDDKGQCDNHADRPAVLVTDFKWSEPQRFCAQCVPSQYRHLL